MQIFFFQTLQIKPLQKHTLIKFNNLFKEKTQKTITYGRKLLFLK